MALSPQWLDELRARVTLSSVIQRTTKLQKAGREWKACCPFHNESTPSFTVNDQKAFYHCFGCGAHGDVIRWMTDQRGLGFMDAVKELAAEAGMDVPAPDPVAAQKAEKRAELIDVTVAAQEWFVERLGSDVGAKARKYLGSRGFSDGVIREFGFGYAPDDKQALPGALASFDEAMLVESGMRIETENREHYDRFRDRLMLPIQDARGRVIAFGGRILDKRDGVAKYLNSPDTPLFDKGSTLYNLHRASPASRKTNRVVVVEGYMDVIALANAGIGDAVAPLGTALTERQIELLWRMVERPVLCFDGDAAGQRAAMRAATRALPLLRPGHSLGIVRMPKGLDPDDFLIEHGAPALEKLLAEPASLLDTLWEHERVAQPLDSPEAKAGLKARLLTHVDTIEDQDIRSLYRRELLDRFSAFAFPKKDYPGKSWSKRPDTNVVDLWSIPEKSRVPIRPKDASIWTQREVKTHKRLGSLLFAGSLRHVKVLQESIDLFEDVIAGRVDDRLWILVDHIEGGGGLDQEAIDELLKLNNLSIPKEEEWDGMHFPFVRDTDDIDYALDALKRGYKLYTKFPLIKRDLREATLLLERHWTEFHFEQQKRLLKSTLEGQAELFSYSAAA